MMEPPKKDSKPTEKNVHQLNEWLTSIIAGHPNAVNTYTFYDEIDKYLGPWGMNGYPIAYGKKYNVEFTNDHRLMSNYHTSRWVSRTTIKLQEALRDFIVEAYRDNRLYPSHHKYWQPEYLKESLREAAFASHSKAYTEGGLTIVALLAPEMIATITSIPLREFSPISPNFQASVSQVLETIRRVTPLASGTLAAAAAGPAHTGMLQNAFRADRDAFSRHVQLSDSLGWLERSIESGQLDIPPTLDSIVKELEQRQFDDQQMADYARRIIESAKRRKRKIAGRLRDEACADLEDLVLYDWCLPGWWQP